MSLNGPALPPNSNEVINMLKRRTWVPDAVENYVGSIAQETQAETPDQTDRHIAALIADRLTVPSHHHQAVDEHPGFRVVARDGDGVVQAMEADGDRFAVGVQWHPETADDSGVFDGLVAAARERAARRG